MSTDTSLSAIEIICLYGLRFKIEPGFKQAVHVIGSFSYHFWMKKMQPLRRKNGNQYLHRESADYRDAVKRKINAYPVFILSGVVSVTSHHFGDAFVSPIRVRRFKEILLRILRRAVNPACGPQAEADYLSEAIR